MLQIDILYLDFLNKKVDFEISELKIEDMMMVVVLVVLLVIGQLTASCGSR